MASTPSDATILNRTESKFRWIDLLSAKWPNCTSHDVKRNCLLM